MAIHAQCPCCVVLIQRRPGGGDSIQLLHRHRHRQDVFQLALFGALPAYILRSTNLNHELTMVQKMWPIKANGEKKRIGLVGTFIILESCM